jgi:hypothetical protein
MDIWLVSLVFLESLLAFELGWSRFNCGYDGLG